MTKNTPDRKVALITGSTSGIGLGILQKLGSLGYNLVMNGLVKSPADVEGIIAKLKNDHGVEILFSQANLADPDQITDMMDAIQQKFGRLDVVVNNAGIQFVSPIEDFPVEKWNQIIALNLSAVFHITRLVVPQMKARGWGRIINIASAHALVASPFKSAYVAAKHGIAGLTKTVALEMAEHGITCNAICPGYVLTPLVEGQIDDTAKARGITRESVIRDVLLGSQPTKKFVKVEDIADYAAFLCSDSASSITGAILSIDGGWTAH